MGANLDFDAKQAKALVVKYVTEGDEETLGLLGRILLKISERATKGESTITLGREFYGSHDRMLVGALKTRGFKATVTSDQRDGDYMTVTW
jgi:hypothetical protein